MRIQTLELLFSGDQIEEIGNNYQKGFASYMRLFPFPRQQRLKEYDECTYQAAMCTHATTTSFAIVGHGLNFLSIFQRSCTLFPAAATYCLWPWKIILLKLIKLDGNSLLLYSRVLSSWPLLKDFSFCLLCLAHNIDFLLNLSQQREHSSCLGLSLTMSRAAFFTTISTGCFNCCLLKLLAGLLQIVSFFYWVWFFGIYQ